MKRSREDDFLDPPPKRPVISSPRKDSGPNTINRGGAAAQKLITVDVIAAYLEAVKQKFQDNREKYQQFFQVMIDFKAQRIDMTGVVVRVKEILIVHPDLILGFNTFLPKGHKIALPLEDDDLASKKPVGYELGFLPLEDGDLASKKPVGCELGSLPLEDGDLASKKPVGCELGSLSLEDGDLASKKPVGCELGSLPLEDGDLSSKRPVGCELGSLPLEDDDLASKKPVGCKIGSLPLEDDDLASKKPIGCELGFNTFLPKGYEDDLAPRKPVEFDKAADLVNKIKKRFQHDDHVYKVFSDILSMYRKKNKSILEVYEEVASLFLLHPDLLDDFTHFLPDTSAAAKDERSSIMPMMLPIHEDNNEMPMKEDRYKETDEMDKDRVREREKENRDEYIPKPISELDLSNCKSCCRSYRVLPQNYPMPTSSGRSELEAQVLNDHYVSVASGSEDYSFNHRRKNPYEESLFKCEDDMFELDMLIESVNATTKSVKKYMDKMNTETTVCVEEHFTASNLRCMERLYGDLGLDVMDVFLKNPDVSLPVLLSRLKKKQEELARCRSDFNKVWAGIYAKNHYKSLDHHGFYFNQQSTKSSNTKALFAENKVTNEHMIKSVEVGILENGVVREGTRVQMYREGSVGHSMVEREEGEQSPSEDFEEDNFGAYGNTGGGVMPNEKYQYGEDLCSREARREKGTDVDDEGAESAQRAMEDSENASEAGEYVSGSESSDEQYSLEDHEQEEKDAEDFDKAESEREAEEWLMHMMLKGRA